MLDEFPKPRDKDKTGCVFFFTGGLLSLLEPVRPTLLGGNGRSSGPGHAVHSVNDACGREFEVGQRGYR